MGRSVELAVCLFTLKYNKVFKTINSRLDMSNTKKLIDKTEKREY